MDFSDKSEEIGHKIIIITALTSIFSTLDSVVKKKLEIRKE